MIYFIPTKRGMGVEIWGTHEDLTSLYFIIGKFWSREDWLDKTGFKSRDQVISTFSYELRKAKDEMRLKRKTSHFSIEPENYFGFKISWVHLFFALSSLRFNMRHSETTKLDISHFLNLEYWLEASLIKYDANTAQELLFFVDSVDLGLNEFTYNYLRGISLDFFRLGGGKRAFKQLPILLKRGLPYTSEYEEYKLFLTKESEIHKCSINDLELNDDDFDYETVKW